MKKKRETVQDNSSDVMKEMRERYDLLTDAEREERELAIEDLRFVTVPGETWDEKQRKARRGRPCYEFPILRSHWRQVCNDQKRARPSIKVRAVEDSDADGAELRAGIIKNIESQSNADIAYDQGFELLAACGFGAWRVVTEYSSDDSWDLDLRIRPIDDALTSVWLDPAGSFGFLEETISRDEFRRRYPKAQEVSFESAKDYGSWFGEDDLRIAEYWRKIEVTKTLVRMSNGKTVVLEDLPEGGFDQLLAQGHTEEKRRPCKGHKVVMSIVSGVEEVDGPHESVFDRIPIVVMYANRFKIDGRWTYCGMVRFSRDPQKLVNYNLTTAQEIASKQPKSPYLLTPKMLEGDGVKALWDRSNAIDAPYLTYTPDPSAPNASPIRLPPPDMPAAFTNMAQMAIDMLKASDGIFDASVGARSNEISGRAIMARQAEGDTATFDYQDTQGKAIQQTGEIILPALPKVYDTARVMRVIGKDGAEDWVRLYDEVTDPRTGIKKTVNDLGAGKYDITVSTGPSYDTQRMEFIDALVQLGQGNPLVAQAVPDLIVGAMDFPKADEAAERLKMLLPPPVQQMLQKGKEMPPEVMQAMQQVEQMGQQAQAAMEQVQQAAMELQQEAAKTDASKRELDAAKREFEAGVKLANAELKTSVLEAEAKMMQAQEGEKSAVQAEQVMSVIAEAEMRAAQAVQMVTEAMTGFAARQAEPEPSRKQITLIRDDAGTIIGAESVEIPEMNDGA
jgi:hypothetical protein